jgi:protoheme ferro-lyase
MKGEKMNNMAELLQKDEVYNKLYDTIMETIENMYNERNDRIVSILLYPDGTIYATYPHSNNTFTADEHEGKCVNLYSVSGYGFDPDDPEIEPDSDFLIYETDTIMEKCFITLEYSE